MKTLALVVMGLSAMLPCAAHAATQKDAEAAMAAAQHMEDEAGKLGNRWVPAEAMLKAARKALEDQEWDKAASAAAEARALAERAIAQSNEQETAWHDAVIH